MGQRTGPGTLPGGANQQGFGATATHEILTPWPTQPPTHLAPIRPST